MNIQLKEWRVKNLSCASKQEEMIDVPSDDNKKFQLSFGHAFSNENAKEFFLGFKIGIVEKTFDLELEIIFVFETDSEIDEGFKDSAFLKINAPAIAFPYIRSYISNLTLQSGYPPIILPSINFVALNESKNN
ncbi:protein-export chaperone SecB [Bacteroides acidifaciens]|jgi:preprotein translocase subunit SecB|uniref:protein-export chaperone SecB n=1 Tax=Bacteroides acidifaciens TaxID=85831 RepID=UPI0025839EC7|nr:protein-export chaperone SecB [Bacteroides acidifaciens]